jgi:hypothetical protein
MKRRMVSAVSFICFFFILFSSMIWISSAQTDASQTPIGVKVGDEFTYSSKLTPVSGVSLSERATDFYSQFSSLEWFKVTITNIDEASHVDYSILYHFSDGTESTVGTFNGTTYLDGRGGDFLVFPSTLTSGDRLYPYPADEDASSYSISETVPVIYASGDRMTNHVQIADFGHHLQKGDLYFDQDTGMLVQYNLFITQSIDSTVAALSWNIKLTGSNVWTVGSSPTITPSSTLSFPTITPTVQPTPTPNPSPTPVSASPTPNQSIAFSYWLNPMSLTAIAAVIVIVVVALVLVVYFRKHYRIVSKGTEVP